MVLVDDGTHQGADVERLLAIWVGRVGEDVADRREVDALDSVRRGPDVTIGRIVRGGAARPAFARSPVRQVVVVHEDAVSLGEGGRPVLGFPVRSHDPRVATDAEVVLGRHPAGVVDRLLAGQHHRAVGGHHEDALGVHQHRRLGVPVRLGADVDARDHDVDLATALGVLHEPSQHLGDPVEVLAARVHGDLGAGRQGVPLERDLEPFGEVDGREQPPALGFADRSHRLGGVAEHGDPLEPFGVALGGGADHADDDTGSVLAGPAVHGDELAALVEVVLEEGPVLPSQHRQQLVGVDEPAPPGLDQLAGVVVERLHRRRGRIGEPHRQASTGFVPQPHHRLHGLVGVGYGEPAADDDLLEAQALRQRSEPACDGGELVERQVDDGPDVEQHAVPLEAVRTGELGAGPSDGVEAADEDVLDLREGDDPAVVVAHRRHVADLGHRDESSVRRLIAGDAVEEVELARSPAAG